MTNSINTNIAAYYAQANITAASNASSSSVARLSSGNRIVEASDDVAALAIGTSLGTQVSALKTAQTNASQGSSLLQVADGALAQIQSILQQQQSIAQQAESGSLTDTDRGFLNQEFQALSQQIDSLASGTTFNGVQLIDGSIAVGGSTSSNPLQNNGVVGSGTVIAPTGFTDLTGALNQSKAGTTYVTGAYVAAAGAGFNGTTTVTQPTNSYDESLYGSLGTAGTFSSSAVGGSPTTITSYTITYTAGDGTTYTGSLASGSSDGKVAAAATLTLTATTNPATHATLSFTVGATGWATSQDNGTLIDAALKANLGTIAYTSGTFGAAPVITQPTNNLADPALHGDLSQGAVTVQLATAAGTTTTNAALAKGYEVSYSLNGTTYTGFLAGNGTAGDIGVAAAATLILTGPSAATNATLKFTVGTQFGASLTATVDQSANIKSAIQANLAGATALNSTVAGTVTGEAAQAGIGLVSYTSDPTKNDTSFVGDLSKGVFTVTGSASSGYSVSYAINGSTFQGSLSAAEVANGGKLVLDNGTGSLAFAITGDATVANASTASSTAFQTALTSQFSAATAHATHLVASTLESNGSGGTVPGSAITATSTAGTLLDGFDGSDVTLTSGTYDGGASNLPPISDFTATGSGTSTVFSVNIGGQIYTTQGAVVTTNDATTGLKADTFDGATGILNFYLNGDKTTNPAEVLKLDLSSIGASAKIGTTADVTNVVNALNSAFGGGGASGTGGLSFQLGTTATSNVNVNIGSAKTTALFAGATLDVSTQSGASAAADAVTNALSTVTSIRSGVGALESRFNFASAALQSSVQNQTSAQSALLDTDIASESTNFATDQVKLQAGISVLAQANQQLQALLKLIG